MSRADGHVIYEAKSGWRVLPLISISVTVAHN